MMIYRVLTMILSILSSFICMGEGITPVKKLVEDPNIKGVHTIKAAFVELLDERSLLFLVEEDEYIIPVRLKKLDLGAINRFVELDLEEEDSLLVTGTRRYLGIDGETYVGLDNAIILEVHHYCEASDTTDIDIEECVGDSIPEDPRASFPGMGSKESLETEAVHQPSGRTNVHLQGRKVDGQLVAPNYKRQESGVVVVSIWVDVYGNVQKAIPGAKGTTVKDANLWSEARSAAMRTHFTKIDKIEEDTPPLQEGTITYIFKLK